MSYIRIKSISIKNYRSFGRSQSFNFPHESYKKPIAIVGYNNAGKSNLLNSILYGLQVNYVTKDTFSIDDFHDRDIRNIPEVCLITSSSIEKKYDGKIADLNGKSSLEITIDGSDIEGASVKCFSEDNRQNYHAFGANKYFNIYYINFHNIKNEISTQKTSWGNLKSFLAKHIKRLVDTDQVILGRRISFEKTLKDASKAVMQGNGVDTEQTKLFKFIQRIKHNYDVNLRNKVVDIDFTLPEFEDIFLKMIFKIGLNDDRSKLISIEHFGDGYISMFVMAVLLAIAEENTEDKCLFIFEEPESFLHENHQEYFYQNILRVLAEKGHQVIYTTHSAKMVDIFDTQGLIRLENCNGETINKYNKTEDFDPKDKLNKSIDEIVTFANYNEFIKTIDPNLNKLLFSNKAILVEGPNDVLVYKSVIKTAVENSIKKSKNILDKKRYAETYLNFKNYAIIPHFGKITAIYLASICKWFGLEYYIICDWDINPSELIPKDIEKYSTLDNLHLSDVYLKLSSASKAQLTNNWNLINISNEGKIHFNNPKLESVINYDKDDKNSFDIYKIVSDPNFVITKNLLPDDLCQFLDIVDNDDNSEIVKPIEHDKNIIQNIEDIPF